MATVCSVLFSGRKKSKHVLKMGRCISFRWQLQRNSSVALSDDSTEHIWFLVLYNSLPRLRPGRQIKNCLIRHFWRFFFFFSVWIYLCYIRTSWCGDTSQPQPQQHRRCIVAQPCRVADWSPWETLQQGCRGDDDQVTAVLFYLENTYAVGNKWEGKKRSLQSFIYLSAAILTAKIIKICKIYGETFILFWNCAGELFRLSAYLVHVPASRKISFPNEIISRD